MDLREQAVELIASLQQFVAGLPGPEVNAEPKLGQPGPICWGAKVSSDFRASVLWIEGKLSLPANKLMACMAFETGLTFSPSKRNPNGTATGLIQFIETTAVGLGTTTAALAKLSAVRQLSYVYRYFEHIDTNFSQYTLEDVYMCILLPSMIGKGLDEPMNWPSKAYAANKGLDIDKNGVVTKREATKRVRELYELGMQPENMA